ncbi:hypothetical protein [Neosynechococcus sphagnicola]|uniref:hypothetical protein n=1 Tax=Neosynechococcus sphagnicola TaxID=1501145 RepID=UPI000A677EFF
MVQSPVSGSQTYSCLGGYVPLPTTPLFGTDGIRGRVGELLGAPLALQVGYWAGQVLRGDAGDSLGPVIVGQDSRTSSDMLAMAIAAGLTAAGLEVWNLGLCPTPGVAYLTSASHALGGVMISASHNPPEDNGIKIFGADGTKLSVQLQQQIEAALRGNGLSGTPTFHWGKYCHRPQMVETYGASLHQSIVSEVSLQGMRVVLDLAWGAATRLAPEVFQATGAEVICLHDTPGWRSHQCSVWLYPPGSLTGCGGSLQCQSWLCL